MTMMAACYNLKRAGLFRKSGMGASDCEMGQIAGCRGNSIYKIEGRCQGKRWLSEEIEPGSVAFIFGRQDSLKTRLSRCQVGEGRNRRRWVCVGCTRRPAVSEDNWVAFLLHTAERARLGEPKRPFHGCRSTTGIAIGSLTADVSVTHPLLARELPLLTLGPTPLSSLPPKCNEPTRRIHSGRGCRAQPCTRNAQTMVATDGSIFHFLLQTRLKSSRPCGCSSGRLGCWHLTTSVARPLRKPPPEENFSGTGWI